MRQAKIYTISFKFYIYEHKDKEILIEQKKTGRENRKRLLDYYSKILSARNGEPSKERQQALDRLVENMTEQEAGEKFSAMGNDTFDKLMAYLSVLLKLTQKEQEIADALEDVLELFCHHRFVYEGPAVGQISG